MEKYRFSVVTPNLNMANYLPDTIESVLSNLRSGDEYFVIDGGSTGNDVEIIKKYENDLTGWVSEPDKGYADGIAKGFSRCTGEFMCWVNSGDILLKGALEKAREILTETDTDLIFGDDLYIDEYNRVISHSSGYVQSLEKMMLYGGWTPLQDACFWRKSIYDCIGGLDTQLKYAADYSFFLNIALNGKTIYAPFIFSAFRKHACQKSSSSKKYKQERQLIQKRMMPQKTSRFSSYLLESIYTYKARWRAYVGSKFTIKKVSKGTIVDNLRIIKVI